MRLGLVFLFWVLVGCAGSGGPANSASGDECGLASGQTGVRICSFVATPTSSESVTLKNYGPESHDLAGWTLWDANALGNGTGSKSLTGTVLTSGQAVTFTSLPFQINDSGETITIKDSSSTIVHQRSN